MVLAGYWSVLMACFPYRLLAKSGASVQIFHSLLKTANWAIANLMHLDPRRPKVTFKSNFDGMGIPYVVWVLTSVSLEHIACH